MAIVARSTMAYIIKALRMKMNDTDSVIWDDIDLQGFLDMHRSHVKRELLSRDVDEKIYLSRQGMLEGTYADDSDTAAVWDTDTSIISLWDSYGSAASAITPDHWNLIDGQFLFDTDQDGAYYLDSIAYKQHGAIAECLEQLAMEPERRKQWSRGGISYTHYDLMEMAKYHRKRGGNESGVMRAQRVYH